MARIAFTAPHHKASETGLDILRQGGTACEAMVAAAAMIAVQYPHMNSIGGDGFWLIAAKDKPPVAIDACGSSAQSIALTDYDLPRITTARWCRSTDDGGNHFGLANGVAALFIRYFSLNPA